MRKSKITKYKEEQKKRILAPWAEKAKKKLESLQIDMKGRKLEPGKDWNSEDWREGSD